MNSQVDVVKVEPNEPEVIPSLPPSVIVAFFDECNICHERFALQEDHVQHMTCHQVSHPAACRRCPSRFATPGELSEHIKQQHVPIKRRRKPGPAKVDRVLRCVVCGIDSFPSFSYFHDHHLYHHLVTRPEPAVILERPQPAAVAAAAALKLTLRRSSLEQNGAGQQFEVIPSDGCSSDSGMESSEPPSVSGPPPEAPPSPAERLPSDEGLAPGDEDSRWSAGDIGAVDEDSLSRGPEDTLRAEDTVGEEDPLAEDPDLGEGDPLDEPYGEDEEDPDEPSAIDPDFDSMNPHISDEGSGDADEEAETVDAGLSGGAEPAAEGDGVVGDVLPEGEEQDDVLRLLDSLNREAGARGTSTPPPPRLLPVPEGSPTPQRLTASAPPADTEVGSPAPPRSVASDPGTSAGDADLAPSLQDLVPGEQRAAEAGAPEAGTGAAPEGQGEGEQGSGQPLIRMAAIAANIPDEQSFRHDPPATPQPPQLQPRPDGQRPLQPAAAGLPPLTPGTPPAAPPGSVSCFVCQLPLPTVAALQEHLLTHQDSLQCSMCPFKAGSVTDLKAHSVTFHGKMQPGTVGRPPNSNMSGHMASMQPPMASVGRPPMTMQPGARFSPIRRGRPPLDAARVGQLPHMNGLRGRGVMGPRGMQQGRMPGVSPQKRPMPGAMMGQDPKRLRPGIPIQPDKSDCQVIAVQRRQQGVPVIHNVEGNAYGGSGQGTIRLSDSITLSVQQSAPAATSASGPGSDVASILANRGISITPSAAAAPPAAVQPPISLPNLPAGISLTPAAGGSDGFAVPRPPGVQTTNVSRPSRPPTVDLTVDTPSPPSPVRGSLSCRYCERSMPSHAALVQHEKAHLSGPNQNLRCRFCGIVMQNMALLQQHMQTRHGQTLPPASPGRGSSELVVPVFDLSQVSRDQLEALGVRGFLPVSQVNQRQGQLGLPIISLQGLGKSGPSPRPVAFFNLGPVRPLR